uniref:Calmodulin n=1 Tax=Macrostomum lignano TaxID=282301 RepID=A0A1I8JPS8_9PLAT
MRSLGQEMPDSQLQAIGAVANARRNVADKDGRNQRSDKRSGSIDFSEFVALMETRKTEDELRSEIQETFKVFDRDQDGPLELRHVLSNLGIKLSEREAADMIAEADFNKDGLVDFEEFYRMMTARNAASKQRNKAFKKLRTISAVLALLHTTSSINQLTRIKVHLEPKSHVMLRRCFKIETLLRRGRPPAMAAPLGHFRWRRRPQRRLPADPRSTISDFQRQQGRTSPCPAASITSRLAASETPSGRSPNISRSAMDGQRNRDFLRLGGGCSVAAGCLLLLATSCDCGGCPTRPTTGLAATAQRPWTPAVMAATSEASFSSPLSTEEVLAAKQIWPMLPEARHGGISGQRDALYVAGAADQSAPISRGDFSPFIAACSKTNFHSRVSRKATAMEVSPVPFPAVRSAATNRRLSLWRLRRLRQLASDNHRSRRRAAPDELFTGGDLAVLTARRKASRQLFDAQIREAFAAGAGGKVSGMKLAANFSLQTPSFFRLQNQTSLSSSRSKYVLGKCNVRQKCTARTSVNFYLDEVVHTAHTCQSNFTLKKLYMAPPANGDSRNFTFALAGQRFHAVDVAEPAGGEHDVDPGYPTTTNNHCVRQTKGGLHIGFWHLTLLHQGANGWWSSQASSMQVHTRPLKGSMNWSGSVCCSGFFMITLQAQAWCTEW